MRALLIVNVLHDKDKVVMINYTEHRENSYICNKMKSKRDIIYAIYLSTYLTACLKEFWIQ